MGGIKRGERNLTIQRVATVAKGFDLTLSELLTNIEREVGVHKQPKRT